MNEAEPISGRAGGGQYDRLSSWEKAAELLAERQPAGEL